jgi:hypothetical protein
MGTFSNINHRKMTKPHVAALNYLFKALTSPKNHIATLKIIILSIIQVSFEKGRSDMIRHGAKILPGVRHYTPGG